MADDRITAKHGHYKRHFRNQSEKKRRDQFNVLVHKLSANVVPDGMQKMDKSSVLQATITFLQTHQGTTISSHTSEMETDLKPPYFHTNDLIHLMLDAVGGFVVVFLQHGDIMYISDGVFPTLGYPPCDLLHTSIFNLVHKSETCHLLNTLNNACTSCRTGQGGTGQALGAGNSECNKEDRKLAFSCHLRRRASVETKEPEYEFVKAIGNFRQLDCDVAGVLSASHNADSTQTDNLCFVCIVWSESRSCMSEVCAHVEDEKAEFTCRHSMEWKFIYLDDRGPSVIGYLPVEVLGTSGYNYYHPGDLEQISRDHEQVLKNGEGTSSYYRFLTKGEQWIWLRTYYCISYHQWTSRPEFVVCTNTVVRSIGIKEKSEGEDCILNWLESITNAICNGISHHSRVECRDTPMKCGVPLASYLLHRQQKMGGSRECKDNIEAMEMLVHCPYEEIMTRHMESNVASSLCPMSSDCAVRSGCTRVLQSANCPEYALTDTYDQQKPPSTWKEMSTNSMQLDGCSENCNEGFKKEAQEVGLIDKTQLIADGMGNTEITRSMKYEVLLQDGEALQSVDSDCSIASLHTSDDGSRSTTTSSPYSEICYQIQ